MVVLAFTDEAHVRVRYNPQHVRLARVLRGAQCCETGARARLLRSTCACHPGASRRCQVVREAQNSIVAAIGITQASSNAFTGEPYYGATV